MGEIYLYPSGGSLDVGSSQAFPNGGERSGKIQGNRKVQRIGGGNALCAHSSDASCAAPHCPSFSKRLSCEEWAVHDVGRHVAAYYDGKQVTIVRVESLKTDIAYSQDEEGFRQLWRDYYRHMAIRERNNPTAQRSFLPKKYWAYLTEMGGKT